MTIHYQIKPCRALSTLLSTDSRKSNRILFRVLRHNWKKYGKRWRKLQWHGFKDI
ncbi:unnamed protein product [Soboliphyme baturini]|uniref:Transposase n=1 Tax=Soboliphyme baturini TaxID=241478 RepID=A0A183J1M2_9BILA|nr:unnamed protein product [Soboliphyme baturini]